MYWHQCSKSIYIGINARVTDVTDDGNVKIELESEGFAIQIFSVMEDDKSLSDYGLTSTVAKAQQPAEVVQMAKMMVLMMLWQ